MIFDLEKYGCAFCLLLMVFFIVPDGAKAEKAKRVYTLETSITRALTDNWGLKAQKETVSAAEYIKNRPKRTFTPSSPPLTVSPT